jgi:hypothetical protein
MKKKLFFLLSVSTLLLSFCASPAPIPGATETAVLPTPLNVDTATAPVEIPTNTFTPTVQPNPGPSQTPTVPAISDLQFIAYARDGQLLVTDVTGGVQGGTGQYTMPGVGDQVSDIVWSPSGEFVAFVSNTNPAEPHIFYIFALGESSPTDLGPGSLPAWSPDSTSIAYVGGSFPDNNIWVTTIENPAPRQLTFEKNYSWGRPAFTPDGQSMIVAGVNRNDLGASGNTTYTLESLALDGSGTHTALPAATQMQGVRLPLDLRFSPNGQKLSFSTSSHFSACAAPGAYYVSNPDGSNMQTLYSPSLNAAIDPNKQIYPAGLSYGWSPTSDAIVALGNVLNCDFNSPDSGKNVAGPQLSVLGLDGNERLVIPGFFWNPSMDRTGTLIAASHLQNIQDTQPILEIYSAQTGQLVLSLGVGSLPVFQP